MTPLPSVISKNSPSIIEITLNMDNSGVSIYLPYGPNSWTNFGAQSHIKFSGGYVAEGYMANSGTSVYLPYGPNGGTLFGAQSHIKFSGGYVSEGFMANSGASVYLPYGPGSSAYFGAQSHIKFLGGYVFNGYLNYTSGSSVAFNYGSRGRVNIVPTSHVTFANGYLVSGELSDSVDTFSYGSGNVQIVGVSGSQVLALPQNNPNANQTLKSVANCLSMIAVWQNTLFYLDFLAPDAGLGTWGASLQPTVEYLEGLYEILANSDGSVGVSINDPVVVFTPGPDGGGYVALGQLAQNSTLVTSTGSVTVNAGTVCAFSNGYYVP